MKKNKIISMKILFFILYNAIIFSSNYLRNKAEKLIESLEDAPSVYNNFKDRFYIESLQTATEKEKRLLNKCAEIIIKHLKTDLTYKDDEIFKLIILPKIFVDGFYFFNFRHYMGDLTNINTLKLRFNFLKNKSKIIYNTEELSSVDLLMKSNITKLIPSKYKTNEFMENNLIDFYKGLVLIIKKAYDRLLEKSEMIDYYKKLKTVTMIITEKNNVDFFDFLNLTLKIFENYVLHCFHIYDLIVIKTEENSIQKNYHEEEIYMFNLFYQYNEIDINNFFNLIVNYGKNNNGIINIIIRYDYLMKKWTEYCASYKINNFEEYLKIIFNLTDDDAKTLILSYIKKEMVKKHF